MFASAGDGASIGNQLERGEVTLEEFFASLGPLEADVRLVIDPDAATFFGAAWAPNDQMQAFVHEVGEAGYLTALVSNIVHEWIPTWESVIPRSLPFDERVYSCVEGTRKPEPRIYEIALERLGVEPAEAVFLDDFAAMVEGARELGMAAVHVEDTATAIAETRALLGLA